MQSYLSYVASDVNGTVIRRDQIDGEAQIIGTNVRRQPLEKVGAVMAVTEIEAFYRHKAACFGLRYDDPKPPKSKPLVRPSRRDLLIQAWRVLAAFEGPGASMAFNTDGSVSVLRRGRTIAKARGRVAQLVRSIDAYCGAVRQLPNGSWQDVSDREIEGAAWDDLVEANR